MRFEWAALMGKLIYAANISLDGYLEDETGSFDWSVPDDEVHAFWNEHERHIGTSLYGRRMHETMRVWESDDWADGGPVKWRAIRGGRAGPIGAAHLAYLTACHSQVLGLPRD